MIVNTNKKCESCGMPLIREEDVGTNEDHTQNNEYCIHCYKQGKFTHPDFTVEDQINHLTMLSMEKFKISKEQAEQMARAIIPNLKRWRNS